MKRKKAPELAIADILDRVGDVTRRRSNSDLAAALGSNPTTVSNWKTRGTIPWETLYRFAHENGVSFEWLLSGAGPMAADVDGEREKTIKRYEWIIDNLRNGGRK